MRPEELSASIPGAGRRDGFSLLEVLAAVAVLGLVYTVLATAGIQGLRLEGDAGRRLRASLLAEQKILEVEAQVATGQAPELGSSESEEGDYLVRTEVAPLGLEIGDTKASKRARERLERAVGGKAKSEKKPGSLLEQKGANEKSMLLRVDVQVAWQEGASEQVVTRTTYALDSAAAAPLIEALVAAAEKEKAEELRAEAGREQSTRATEGQAAGALPAADGGLPAQQRLRAQPGAAPDADAGDDE